LIRVIYKNLSVGKKLIKTITILTIIMLISCVPPPGNHVRLPVPFISQMYNAWCGAACIQMWAYYDGLYPEQDDIASFIGWTVSNIYNIAAGVGYFTNSPGYPVEYGSSEYEQDLAMSAQVASIKEKIPSISIINHGTHAIIAKGFDWTDTSLGPRADGICIHDPWLGPNFYHTAGNWKHWFFTDYYGHHLIVLGDSYYLYQGESGYIEFLNQGGTYYGGPKHYKPEQPI